MGVVGWFFARFWIEGAIFRRNLSMLLFVQLCLAVAYVPAKTNWVCPESRSSPSAH
jgi:hypothetical protein